MNYEHVSTLLDEMHERKASDLYLTFGSPPALRIYDDIHYATGIPITDVDLERYIGQILTPEQKDEFDSTFELNIALNWRNDVRFRVNVFRQQAHDGLVIRRIQMEIPLISDLKLPQAYADMALQRRGLVMIAGPTGSGKSTSLAALVGHRNLHSFGHIVTVEDPIEFVHQHINCIVTQRDIGIDTYSYSIALKNALRQRPDMVVIGEVRDREVMEQAIHFAETGHLCVATIHANNSSQAIERILNFFPEDRHPQLLMNLAMNLRGILSQRLVPNVHATKSLALEVMLNQGIIRQLIIEGKTKQMREFIEKGGSDGMVTFDQSLLELYKKGEIDEAAAIAESDSPANLRLEITHHKRSQDVEQPTVTHLQIRKANNSDF